MLARWEVVDELVHELGALRATVREAEGRDVGDASVVVELRASLERAADDIHLVIGGNDGMVSRARRSIALAQEVGTRARTALRRARALHDESASLRNEAAARQVEAKRRIRGLHELQEAKPPSAPPRGDTKKRMP